jgi:hypothetical protein
MNQLASTIRPPTTLPAEPPRARAIPEAITDLNRAQSRVTGALSELMKRLQPVLRIEPAAQSHGVPPQGSTGCELADSLVGEINALDRAADTLNSMISSLEV